MTDRSALPEPTSGATFATYGADDHAAEATIRAAVTPDSPRTIESLRHDDTTWDDSAHWRARAIARDTATGAPVAFVRLAHMPWQFRPDRYLAEVLVVPDARGRGLGRAAATWIDRVAEARRAVAVRVNVSESDARSGAFAEACGYIERQRSWESRLDVNLVAGEPLAAHTARVVADGIVIRTLSELVAESNSSPLSTQRGPSTGQIPAPEAQATDHPTKDGGRLSSGLALSSPGAGERALLAAIHTLDTDASADLPGLDPPTPVPYDVWAADVIEGPDALPDATFLAIDPAGKDSRAGTPGPLVGICVLGRTPGVPGSLSQGLTAVVRGYRGRGIAQALKARTITYARAHGYREIRTWNHSQNVPMLRINERLGFVRQPARRTMVKDYRTDQR